MEPKTAKILTIKLSLQHPIWHSWGENHKTQLSVFHFSFNFLHFLVKQTGSDWERERERTYLEGLDCRREERVLKECLWRVLLEANIGVNQRNLSLSLSLTLLFCFESLPSFHSSNTNGVFTVQGFRFGVWEINLFTNLVLHSKLFTQTVEFIYLFINLFYFLFVKKRAFKCLGIYPLPHQKPQYTDGKKS